MKKLFSKTVRSTVRRERPRGAKGTGPTHCGRALHHCG